MVVMRPTTVPYNRHTHRTALALVVDKLDAGATNTVVERVCVEVDSIIWDVHAEIVDFCCHESKIDVGM